jgi:IS30 family transposase
LSERVQIEVEVAAGELNEVIAAGLGRAPSTVGREFGARAQDVYDHAVALIA